MKVPAPQVRWLGRVEFSHGLEIQEETRKQRLSGDIPDTLLLLEHEPVFTIGRSRDRSSLGDTQHLPFPVVEINRGGKATFHGPGQLVGYAIYDLNERGRDLRAHLRALEDLLLLVCRRWNVPAYRKDSLTGIWTDSGKLASIGVGVRQWISMHGFALNVESRSIDGFQHITPCGLTGVRMTCMASEIQSPVSMPQAVETITGMFQETATQIPSS